MAAEYIATEQSVALNNPILFTASIPCRRGCIYHEDGQGVFILRGNTNQCFAQYQVVYNGNIAVAEGGGAVTPIALSLAVNGETRPSSTAVFTPSAVGEFGNVTSTAIIKVPRGCCFSLSVDYVSATTATPTPLIDVQNSNLTITRIA